MARTVLDRDDAVRALAGVFRRRGFDAASLSTIQQETGMGRGSLYHFFPDGKVDMARAVLAEVQAWFEREVFDPLRTTTDPTAAVSAMCATVRDYFLSRQRVCLFAVVTIGQERPAFDEAVRRYFTDWVTVLAGALRRGGTGGQEAHDAAVDAVAAVQGGLVLARALGDDSVVTGVAARTERRLLAVLP